MGQIDFYNEFGEKYKNQIINSANPAVWTSDADPNSLLNRLMRERTEAQEKATNKYFSKSEPVLDLGCGFGRQTFFLARNGFETTGVDNSDVFIQIAEELFAKHHLPGKFICESVSSFVPEKKFKQLTCFDVIEHFPAAERPAFIKHIAEKICAPEAILVFTFPLIRKNSVKDQLMNIYKGLTFRIEFLSRGKEHPYPIPTRRSFEKLVRPFFNVLEYSFSSDTAFFVINKR